MNRKLNFIIGFILVVIVLACLIYIVPSCIDNGKKKIENFENVLPFKKHN